MRSRLLVDPPAMRNALPLVLILLAAFAGYVLLTGGEAPEPALGPLDTDPLPTGTPRPGPLEAAPGMTPTGRPRPTPGRPSPPAIDPRTIPRGTLVVHPVGPEGDPIDPRYLTVKVEPVGQKDWQHRLGRRDARTGAWTFPKVLVGPVRVSVRGDHVVATTASATVPPDRPGEVRVVVQRAGAIGYDVLYPDGSRPESVTLTLFDADDRPVKAWYETRGPRRTGSPHLVEEAREGPQGVVHGLGAGRYRLRAVDEIGGYADQTVDVTVGATQAVRFTLSR